MVNLTWNSGKPHIPVTLIENSLWDGMGPDNADFLRTRLSPVTGPVCEVLLVKSDKLRVVFRIHHAVSDAGGLRQIVEDAFRILRGEEPIGPAKGTSLRHIWLRKKIPVREFKLIAKMMLAIKLASDSS